MMGPLVGTSTKPNVAGVQGDGVNVGVVGTSKDGRAIDGRSETGTGVHGHSAAPDGSKGQAGVVGEFDNGVGVFGRSVSSSGVGGMSESGIGVNGVSQTLVGVQGNSPTGRGVAGFSDGWQGVYGHSNGNAGVVGESVNLHGVYGVCHNPNGGGVYGTNDAGGYAAVFDGRVSINGDLEVTKDVYLKNGDCAEEFDVGDEGALPGTVMVLDGGDLVRVSEIAYDKRVAGVVSGAGDYRPALILDSRTSTVQRVPLALMGKVFCLVDAEAAPIAVGDLLTSSAIPGHAMKAEEPARAFGSVIGKALRPLTHGRGLIPILVTLR
jgi:hypothetical protein